MLTRGLIFALGVIVGIPAFIVAAVAMLIWGTGALLFSVVYDWAFGAVCPACHGRTLTEEYGTDGFPQDVRDCTVCEGEGRLQP
jgi:hypothetical protein